MAYLLVTALTPNERIKRVIESTELMKEYPSVPNYCREAKYYFDGTYSLKIPTTVEEKVSKAYEIVSVNVQKAIREIGENPLANNAKNIIKIGSGVLLTGFGLYEGYQCVKNFFYGEKTKALGHGTISLAAIASGGYLIYDGVLNISISPFCKN